MGHIRLGVLPKYRRWTTVVGLLSDPDMPASAVADKVLDGVKKVLGGEPAQSSVAYCVWLLAQLAIASRGEDFGSDIAKLGIRVREDSSGVEFLARASRTAEAHLSSLAQSNALKNIASLALREALTKTVGLHATTLFGAELADVKRAFATYSTRVQFSNLLHIYFTALVRRLLRFIVDKEIANHVGSGKRFGSQASLRDFEDALDAFASKTSRIVDEFSGGWYSKQVWQRGGISESDAGRFVYIALRKLSADLDLNEGP